MGLRCCRRFRKKKNPFGVFDFPFLVFRNSGAGAMASGKFSGYIPVMVRLFSR
jgi:hypothetical protein